MVRGVRQIGVYTFFAAALICHAVAAPTFTHVPELEELFQRHQVHGAFVLFDANRDTMFVSNEERAKQRFPPASTFKIVNSLIGLDVGAISDVEEVLPYGGKPQRLKQWEQDMNLREAIKASNVPVYQELARRIGVERMRAALKKLAYGNMETGAVVDRFWLDGPLASSAVEQAEFLDRLAAGKLPVKPEAVSAVKEITLLEKTDEYALHGKTGWYWPDDGQQIGWFVGWIERAGKAYPFALNIDIMKDADAAKRIPLARESLKALGKL